MKELLLINIDGLAYGIWKGDVLAAENLPTLHSLPACPAHIAGIAIVHDRTVTLADLSVCIGHVPRKKPRYRCMLLLSDTDKFAGFAVQDDARIISVSSSDVHLMPDYLRTPAINSCVLINSLLVPLINIGVLYDRLQKEERVPLKPVFSVSTRPSDGVKAERIRCFTIYGRRFAVYDEERQERAVEPGPVRQLTTAPSFVLGVTFHNGEVLPVIDLSQRLIGRKSPTNELMLVIVGGAPYGILVQSNEGFLDTDAVLKKDLPPMAQSGWIPSVVQCSGEIIPLLDLKKIVSLDLDNANEQPLPQRYAPDSDFIDRFDREDTNVVEFSLLGQRHALPKSEVKDILNFIPYREIPNVPEIVIGVAEHSGELLPVLDLAMVFGRRSLATPEWRLLHVKNGDFQALVLTETVFGERHLPLEIQRELPIVLPHDVVYGCYPDADSVRLIMNVEALAVYFEKGLVQELLPAMTDEMKQAPAEIVPSLLGELVDTPSHAAALDAPEGQILSLTSETFIESAASDDASIVSGRDVVPDATEQPKDIADAIEAWKPIKIVEDVQEHKSAAAVLQGGKAGAEQVQEESFQKSTEKQADLSVSKENEGLRLSRIEAAVEEALKKDSVEVEAVAISEPHSLPDRPSAVLQKEAVVEPERLVIQGKKERISPEPVSGTEQELRSSPVAEAEKNEEKTSSILEQTFSRPEQKKPVVLSQISDSQTISSFPAGRGRKFIYVAIGGVLVLLLFVDLILWQTGVGKKEQPGKTVTGATETAKKKPRSKAAQKQLSGPLVFELPADSAVESGVYVVNEGDTLWSISERFTGNPFNYPRIAGENLIANPDLIYPEQKIIIKKKEK
jgi:chemotaxis signal transduction protein/nucleoid-associated protein YgaU